MTTTPGVHHDPVTVPPGHVAATRGSPRWLLGLACTLFAVALVASGPALPRTPVAAALLASQVIVTPDARVRDLQARSGADSASRQALQAMVERRTAQLNAQARAIKAEVSRLKTTFSWPVGGAVAVPFGVRVHPISGERRLHNGIDIDAVCGQVVTAPMSGRVLNLGVADDAGYFMRIDHGLVRGVRVYTTYLHLSAFLVRSGPITRGQPVARVGATGDATACHLHFSIVRAGQPVNPLQYLGR